MLCTEIGGHVTNLMIPISKLHNADLTKCGSLILTRGSYFKNVVTTNCGE